MLKVEICMGTSCHLMGNQDLMAALDTLPAEQRQQLEIRGVTCFKNCGKGPSVRINGVLMGDTTPERLLEIIESNL